MAAASRTRPIRQARTAAGYVGGYRADQGPRPSLGQEGAGVLLALFAYPLLVNGLKGGPGQAWQWVRAKWINAGAPTAPSSSPPLPADPGTGVFNVSFRTPAPPASPKAVVL